MTILAESLVVSGHVNREPHPTDRRATMVTPTPKGRKTIRDLVGSHEELALQLRSRADALGGRRP